MLYHRSLLFIYFIYCCCFSCSVTSDSFVTLCTVAPPGFSVHGISQARILGWVAISLSRESSRPRDRTRGSCIGRWIFTTEPPGKPILCTVACIYQSQSPHVSLPLPLALVAISSFSKSVETIFVLLISSFVPYFLILKANICYMLLCIFPFSRNFSP